MAGARAHAFFAGRVQGVGFRAFTIRNAHALGLKGWVRNLPDGRVEAIFEGLKPAVELAVLECKKGPLGARVTDFDVKWLEATGEFDGFSVKY